MRRSSSSCRNGGRDAPRRSISFWLLERARRAPFEVIGCETATDVELGAHHFVGFIDRLDRDDRTAPVTVVDYKTGSIATSAEEYVADAVASSSCRSTTGSHGGRRRGQPVCSCRSRTRCSTWRRSSLEVVTRARPSRPAARLPQQKARRARIAVAELESARDPH